MRQRFLVALLLVLPAVGFLVTRQLRLPKSDSVLASGEEVAAVQKPEAKKRRVVFVGGHPADPESGCGGLIAQLTNGGHEVLIAYVACYRRDRKVGSELESVVNRRESEAACKLLGATPYYFDYTNEGLTADEETLEKISSWLTQVQPDIVVTHWPVDAHSNHHVTGSLIWQSYLRDKKWSLYFFEVLNDRQTIAFNPDLFLDIGEVREAKKEAVYCYQSQSPEGFWFDHEDMHRLRGEKCGVQYAEAYVLAESLAGRAALPVAFLKKSQ